jgi:hypothetical protein
LVLWVLGVSVAGCSDEQAVPADEPGPPRDCVDAEPRSAIDLSVEPGYDEALRLHRWTDANGCLVRLEVLMTRDGPEHCGWQARQELVMGTPLGTPQIQGVRVFARDPQGVLGRPELQQLFDPVADLPAGALDTGYRLGDLALWMTPDDDFVYVAGPRVVERWPREDPPAACA